MPMKTATAEVTIPPYILIHFTLYEVFLCRGSHLSIKTVSGFITPTLQLGSLEFKEEEGLFYMITAIISIDNVYCSLILMFTY